MSFFSGPIDAARSMFGPPANHDAPGHATQPAKPSGEVVSPDASTSWQPDISPVSAVPTLADRLRSTGSILTNADRAVSLPSRIPPHLRVVRGKAPSTAATTSVPTSSAPLTASAIAPAGEAPKLASTAQAQVYDAGTNTYLGTLSTLSRDQDAGVAAANVQRGFEYYAKTFGRNGLDGAGSGVDVLIDDPSIKGGRGGGYYLTTASDGTEHEAIHFGTGQRYAGARGTIDQYSLEHADDLTIHELTHGIIRKETGQLGGEAGASGATNEAIADVMAASATRDWSMGEGMYADDSAYRRTRNIANPNDPQALHGLWTTMDQVRATQAAGGQVEEHWASGVISTAAYRVQQRLGGEAGWSAVEQTFYDTIHSHRMGDMSFEATANALRTSAAALYGQGSAQARAFDQELRRAGL